MPINRRRPKNTTKWVAMSGVGDCAILTFPFIHCHSGSSEFLTVWASHGGRLDILATTADDADDMPGAELKIEEKAAFIDAVPNYFIVSPVVFKFESGRQCMPDLVVAFAG